MGLERDIAVIGRVALFRDLNRDQLRLLAFGAEHQELAAGTELFAENAPADSAYVVVRGEIELFRQRGEDRITIGKVGQGELLGELALIVPGQRSTAAAAIVDSELLRLDQKLFRRLLVEYPETALALHAAIATNLKKLLDRITALGAAFQD